MGTNKAVILKDYITHIVRCDTETYHIDLYDHNNYYIDSIKTRMVAGKPFYYNHKYDNCVVLFKQQRSCKKYNLITNKWLVKIFI